MPPKFTSPDQVIKEGFSQFQGFIPAGAVGGVKEDLAGVETYAEFERVLQVDAKLPKDLAETVASSTLYGLLEKFGIEPEEWKLTITPKEAGKIKYGVEEFEEARKFLGSWTRVAEIALFVASLAAIIVALVGGGLAAATGAALTVLIRKGATKAAISTLLNVNKLRAIKWLSIPSAISALATGWAFFASTQITATGDLTTYIAQGVARGEEAKEKAIQKAADAAAGISLTGRKGPVTIIRMVEEHKPKQFLGTLFSAKIGSVERFDRSVDTEITSMDDLRDDVKINLNRWLNSLPNRMGFSVVVRKDPVDSTGAKQSGIWATLTMFLTHISGKTSPIDTILLGPVNPKVRLELTKQTKTIESEIPGFLSSTEIREIQVPTGTVDIFNTSGERVSLSDVPRVPAPAPTTPAQTTTPPSPSTPKTDTLLRDASGLIRTGEFSVVAESALSETGRRQAEAFAKSQGEIDTDTTLKTPPTPTPTPTPKAKLFKVANTGGEGLNLRRQGLLRAGVITGLADGTIVEQKGGDTPADGLIWWQVEVVSSKQGGWVAKKFLVPV